MSGLVVALIQLSKRPVRRIPTFTLPQSKHWSQLLIANAELELQLTDLYSPREEPADAVTLGAAGRIGGVVSVAEVGVGVGVGSSTAKAALREEIAIAAILVRARDLIGEKERK